MSENPDWIVDPASVQGSDAWLEKRKNFLGGSEAGAILGLSPYLTALMVFNDKHGIEIREMDQYIMEKGNRLEPHVRGLYNKERGSKMIPAVFEKDFFIASLDGHDLELNGAIEIKFTGKDTHELNKKGEVVPYFFAQLVHQFHTIPKLKWIDFVTYWIPPETDEDEGEMWINRVERENAKAAMKSYFKVAKLFWFENVKAGIPPKPAKLDFHGINDKKLNALAKVFHGIKDAQLEIKKVEDELTGQMIAMSKEMNWGKRFRVRDLGFAYTVPPGKKKGFWDIGKIET